jgi:hypothetical protein
MHSPHRWVRKQTFYYDDVDEWRGIQYTYISLLYNNCFTIIHQLNTHIVCLYFKRNAKMYSYFLLHFSISDISCKLFGFPICYLWWLFQKFVVSTKFDLNCNINLPQSLDCIIEHYVICWNVVYFLRRRTWHESDNSLKIPKG